MISLDQILLLQTKVETAVQKISALGKEVEQLKAENDALRTKCSELTNALTVKSELVSTLESDQTKIEQGILNALNRLDTVENSILSSTSSSPINFNSTENKSEAQEAVVPSAVEEPVNKTPAPAASETAAVQETKAREVMSEPEIVSPEPQTSQTSESIRGQFDIF